MDRAAADVIAKGGKTLIPARTLEGRGRMAVLADPDGAPFGLLKSSSGDPPDFRAEPGEWIWAVYQSADAGRAAAFYQDLGNYEVVPGDPVGNAESFDLQAEGFARASLVEIPPGRTELRPEWIYFVRVADVAASTREGRRARWPRHRRATARPAGRPPECRHGSRRRAARADGVGR